MDESSEVQWLKALTCTKLTPTENFFLLMTLTANFWQVPLLNASRTSPQAPLRKQKHNTPQDQNYAKKGQSPRRASTKILVQYLYSHHHLHLASLAYINPKLVFWFVNAIIEFTFSIWSIRCLESWFNKQYLLHESIQTAKRS